ncbi:MAG TPA: hypothetical protein VFI27_01670, partial [candidate division Zixibacteria bacterium]|nr:hypothetical protein [candidate division Zixibacteria bacterium]
MRFKKYWLRCLIVALVALLILAACSSEEEPTVAPTEVPAEVPTEEPMEEPTGEQMEEPTDEPMEEPAEEYVAEIRPAKETWKIGYGDGLAGIPFTDSVTDNINEVAEQMGVEIVHCDNAYDQEKTVECSNLLVTQ